ncbi:MAG: nicotinate-nucleotide adenylyltransferase [Prevotella sp.]|nr:nicotinate-nucleotide adenylyltransferase [Prevotella sp.]
MIKTGIYGGSFNPIHNGHIALAKAFLRQAALDEVWFVVSPQNPFKVNDHLLDDRWRLRLTKAALQEETRLMASDYEFHLPKPSYMWHTLQSMSREYPDREFTLLIGGDNWTTFHRWYHADDILSHYSLAVYPRKDNPIDTATLPPNVQLINAELLDISSTEVRHRITKGQDISHLVPPRVAELITKNRLYF